MKNFSELLDTDYCLKLSIELKAICQNGDPGCRVQVNDKVLLCDHIASTLILTCTLPLTEPIDISISLFDKNYSDTAETAVIISQISIDNFNLVPYWTHMAVYHNERSINNPTSYLGFNGTWQFVIADAFYRWKHSVTGQGWLLAPG